MHYYLHEEAEARTRYALAQSVREGDSISETVGLIPCTHCNQRLKRKVIAVSTRNPSQWQFRVQCPCGDEIGFTIDFHPGRVQTQCVSVEQVVVAAGAKEVLEERLPWARPKFGNVHIPKNYLKPWSAIQPAIGVSLELLVEPTHKVAREIALINQGLHEIHWPVTLVGRNYCTAARIARGLPEISTGSGFYLLPEGGFPYQFGIIQSLGLRLVPPGIHDLGGTHFVTYQEMLLLHAYDPVRNLLHVVTMEWGATPKGEGSELVRFGLWLAGAPAANMIPARTQGSGIIPAWVGRDDAFNQIGLDGRLARTSGPYSDGDRS